MSVSYTAEVVSCKGFGCFLKLLLRWKASVYKLIWMDFLLFITLYYILTGTYRFVLNEDQMRTFEKIVDYCRKQKYTSSLSFVLGFYVSLVMTRWWDQYMSIAWPDSIAVYVSATIHGNDERGRLMRRTIMRYVCVCLTVLLSGVSPRVKKRFPTLEHFVDAGLLLENELEVFQNLNSKFPHASKYWLPIVWASSIVTRARKEGRIRDDFAVKTLIDELNKFRGLCGNLLHYDIISIPLVYTQVVTIAVYAYFLTAIIAHQWIEEKPESPVYTYFPFFLTLEILFYMGWLKVAEILINPFGEDDDDFELNWIIDRNIQLGYLVVDEMHHEHPKLIKDQYWDEVFPTELPYTAATEQFRRDHPEPSTANIQMSAADQEVQPSSVRVDEMENDDSISGSFVDAKFSRHGSRMSKKSKLGGASISGSVAGSLIDKCRKIFGKDDRSEVTRADSPSNSTSMASIKLADFGSMKKGTSIGTIEELDEQLTKTSTRAKSRIHVQDIFPRVGPPSPSEPVDVPGLSMAHHRLDLLKTSTLRNSTGNLERDKRGISRFRQMSTHSVPATCDDVSFTARDEDCTWSSPDISIQEDDDFEKLKAKRQRQRLKKFSQRLDQEHSNT